MVRNDVRRWTGSCSAFCVCICMRDCELGDTLTAERYGVTATRGNGVTYRFIRAHKPPREQSAWGMCWFAEGSRDCNTLMSLHERFSRAWSSRRSQRGFHPVIRICYAHHLRRGSVDQCRSFIRTHRDSWGTARRAACRPARSSGGTRTRGWSRTGPNRSWAARTRAATCSTSATERT